MFKITEEHTPDDLDGKHIVVNCRTGENFACESLVEAGELAAQHDAEAAELAAEPAP